MRNDSVDGIIDGAKKDYIDQIIKAIRQTENGKHTFFDTSDFPWVEKIESNWKSIRKELDHILSTIDMLPGYEDIQSEQKILTQDKRWKIFPFYAYGYFQEENMRRCPETAKILQMIPGLQAAMFSIMEADKKIPPHVGIYCGVLRYQLALKVPPEPTQCGIKVGNDEVNWTEGSSLIFDDTHLHSAWNESDQERVVLFVDFTRPLDSPLSTLNDKVIDVIGASNFIQDARRKWELWERDFGTELDSILSQSRNN